MLQKLLHLTGSQQKMLEILAVMKGQKRVARQGYKDPHGIASLCSEHDLSCLLSPVQIKLLDGHESYSNKGSVTQCDTNDTLKLLYIASSERDAYEASLAELYQHDRKLGELLGYPSCCIAFFMHHKDERKKGDFNYEELLFSAAEKSQYSYLMNIFMRKNDACILSHFPCSLACEKSMEIAKKRMLLLEEMNPAFVRLLKEELSCDVTRNGKTIRFV